MKGLFSFYFISEFDIGHPLISKDLEDMVNQSKHFPSFSDVLDAVGKSNDKHKLKLKYIEFCS